MLSGDLPGALRALHGVAEQGLNLKHFHREMLEYLRSVLLIKAGAADVLDLPDEELVGAREQASTADIGLLQRALTLWSGANLKADSSSPMPLEMAIIDVALYASQPASTPQQTRPARSVAVPEPARPAAPAPRARAASAPAPQPPRPPVRDPTPQPVAKATSNGVSAPDTHIEETPSPAPASDPRPEPVSAPAPVSEGTADISDFKERWPALVDALRGVGSKGSLDAVLRNASEPVALEGDTLVIGFFHEFHKNWIDNPKYRHLVEKKVNEVFGGPYRIRCDLVSKDKSPPIHSGPVISEPAPPERRLWTARLGRATGASGHKAATRRSHPRLGARAAGQGSAEHGGQDYRAGAGEFRRHRERIMNRQSRRQMKQMQDVQSMLAKAQEELADKDVEVSVGGGAVKVVMNGKQEIKSIIISPEVVDPEDVEMLQDLVQAAVSEAIEKSQGLASSHLGGLTAGLNIPGL